MILAKKHHFFSIFYRKSYLCECINWIHPTLVPVLAFSLSHTKSHSRWGIWLSLANRLLTRVWLSLSNLSRERREIFWVKTHRHLFYYQINCRDTVTRRWYVISSIRKETTISTDRFDRIALNRWQYPIEYVRNYYYVKPREVSIVLHMIEQRQPKERERKK